MSVPSSSTAFPFSSENLYNAASPSAIRNMLKFFLAAPFRGLTRLLSLGRLLDREEEPSHIISSSGIYNTEGGSPMTHMASPPPSTFQQSLGPWSFFASGYAISLFAMALLLNRIQNIVVPSRRPPQHHTRSSPHTRSRWALLRLVLPSVFPIDLSSTYSRVVLRLPTMYYILKALLLWTILLLQASDFFPPFSWHPFRRLDDWAAHKEMDEICWFTFRAVCGALCVGALTKGLEGVGTTSTSPFNLFGYSFMLHFYSSPLTHIVKPEGLPSRPDANVLFTVYVPLFQLAMIHFIGAKQSWSNQRLIPTTICSVLTLAHFHWVLWSSPSSYPLLNYVSCIFESLLVLVIIVAFLLNILTQLLLDGSITRLFIGHSASLLPKWDEDFSIVLFRLGIASLDATSVAGLGNEVSCIALTDHGETLKRQVQYGEAEMNRFGVSSITHATEFQGGRRTRKDGFSNEIRRVRVGSAAHGDTMVDATWLNEFRRFGSASARFGIAVWRMVGRLLRGHLVFSRQPATSGRQAQNLGAQPQPLDVGHEGETIPATPDQRDIYERFLSGEALSDDDDDDDFLPSKSSVPQHDDDDDDVGGISPDEDNDALALFTDHSVASSSSTAGASVLLAHMTDTSSSPLTRRRYQNLVLGQGDAERMAWEAFINSRRGIAKRPGPPVNESRRNCVICTTEERQIICWPCRCLALCDDCRQNLASRHSASKHTCPCCRQQVEGFSRIYIP